MSGQPAARVRRIIAVVLACLFVAATVYAVINRQLIQDQVSAARFDASSTVLELKRGMHLTESGERIFLASRPTLDGSQHFNTQCAEVQHGATGHVLGCFTQDRIHLFAVTDPRLSGIVKVTAAHELLHATYARMRPGDRAALAEKLRKLYKERSQSDPDLAERMSMYASLSDAAFAAELHAVFGSEQENLPDWLEEHYAQWFKHRSMIAGTYRTYLGVFRGIKNEASTLRSQMSTLRADVEQRKADYDEAVAAYDKDAADLKRRGTKRELKDDPGTWARLNKELDARRVSLKGTLEDLQDDVNRYNEMRTELEQLATLSTELEQHLDSALAPITTRPTD